MNKKKQPCGTHAKRSQGRGRWEIERAEAQAQKAREEAEAAEQWQREMATPPVVGAVLEIERWKPAEGRVVTDRLTVDRTYANRTVSATTESGEQLFLSRNEYNGCWFAICGQPTSIRLPCKNPACHTQHKAGLRLREDEPWI